MVVTYNADLEMSATETKMEYIQRICANKDILNLSWKQLQQMFNEKFGYTYSESYYRKNYIAGNFISIPEATTTYATCNVEEFDEVYKLKSERVKLRDERAYVNSKIARMSREETIREIAREYAQTMSTRKRLEEYDNHFVYTSKNEGILLLSDWHYGMICDNPWNIYNPEICRKRVSKLLNKTFEIIEKESLKKVTVLNLSDLIAGRIHTQIRIESRFDVITQVMEVSEILAEFLNELSVCCEVDYYDCLDNHSRLEPNKNDSMDLESLVRIIPWYLKERLAQNKRVRVCDNEFGADIITCNVLGHDIIGVHGDNDRPVNALDKLSLMTHRHYDLLCTAHLHHFSADEQHMSMVVSNSSLMGVDRYAEKLRVTSDPSQTLIVATPDNVCECIYRIVLK